MAEHISSNTMTGVDLFTPLLKKKGSAPSMEIIRDDYMKVVMTIRLIGFIKLCVLL